jgi:hypothetical protein
MLSTAGTFDYAGALKKMVKVVSANQGKANGRTTAIEVNSDDDSSDAGYAYAESEDDEDDDDEDGDLSKPEGENVKQEHAAGKVRRASRKVGQRPWRTLGCMRAKTMACALCSYHGLCIVLTKAFPPLPICASGCQRRR